MQETEGTTMVNGKLQNDTLIMAPSTWKGF